ncbi:Ubiquitin fusion degradation protein 1-like protein, partial [Operophtera brumata]
FGFNMFHEIPRPFNMTYKCFSVSMLPGNERQDVERGGKTLEQLTRLSVEYPMIFKLTNKKTRRQTHSGVLEFVADEGKIESVSLPVATFSRFQPLSEDFLDISNPKAVLENCLRNFSCLTTGDVIAIKYNSKAYELCVLETKPGNAVEFAPPVGYKEENHMSRRSEAAEGMDEDPAAMMPEPSGFIAFSGEGNRLDGKKKKLLSESDSEPQVAQPRQVYGLYTCGVGNHDAGAERLVAFSGEGNRLDGKMKKLLSESDSEPQVAQPRQVRDSEPQVAQPRQVRDSEPQVAQPRQVTDSEPQVAQPRQVRDSEPQVAQPRQVRDSEPQVAQPRQVRDCEPQVVQPRQVRDSEPQVAQPRQVRDSEPQVAQPRQVRDSEPQVAQPRQVRDSEPQVAQPRQVRDSEPQVAQPRQVRDSEPQVAQPRQPNHRPDVIEVAVHKGLPFFPRAEVLLDELLSDHQPVLLRLKTRPTTLRPLPRRSGIDWIKFADIIDIQIDGTTPTGPVSTPEEVDDLTVWLTSAIQTAIKEAQIPVRPDSVTGVAEDTRSQTQDEIKRTLRGGEGRTARG